MKSANNRRTEADEDGKAALRAKARAEAGETRRADAEKTSWLRALRMALLPLSGYDIYKVRQMEAFVTDPVEGDQAEAERVRLSMLQVAAGDMAKAGWMAAYVLDAAPIAE